jgi:hypothetical protein
MVVKKKLEKTSVVNIEEVINRGGKTREDFCQDIDDEYQEIRFTLRIPKMLLTEIDKKRSLDKFCKLSRNQWILRAIIAYISD